MTVVERQKVLDCLNSMEVIESEGGDSAYALVENNEENRKLLDEAGIPLETALGYGDKESFCFLSLAFSEGYADLYDGEKLILFEKKFEIELEKGNSIILYKQDADIYLAISKDGGEVSIAKLTTEQIKEIKDVFA